FFGETLATKTTPDGLLTTQYTQVAATNLTALQRMITQKDKQKTTINWYLKRLSAKGSLFIF
ncbi:MAG: hypothetical protein AAF518_18840, partial [Spirochaetota bacterium]